MKKFIIIFGCIMLGATIFNYMLSDDSTSTKSTVKKVMQKHADSYKQTP